MENKKMSVEEISMKLKPVFGKKIDDIYMRYAMADSREEKEEIESILNALYKKHLSELLDKRILLEPPTKQEVEGEYPIGVVSYAQRQLYPFALREHDWIRHVCISGMSGSGKTTLALNMAKQLIEKDKSFMVFDWKKSFRPLLNLDSGIMCFTVGNDAISNLLKININQPPKGIAAKEWINILCDLIAESFFVSYGVHKILLETLDEAFKDFGVYNGSGNYPTWNEIKRRLEAKIRETSGRESNWLMSALRVAHVMTFGNFGKAVNYKGKDSMSIGELLNKKVIFELNALGNIEKKFFCEFILTYIYKLRKANQFGMNQDFVHAIIVDEAHNVFLKEKTHFVKESVTDMIYREMREYGTSLICLDQHISMISDTVVGNSACHIAFQQQLPQDIEVVSRLMQLQDKKQYFSMLPVGSAMVKLSERYAYPFLVAIPDSELRKIGISDKDVETRMKFFSEARSVVKNVDPEFSEALMPTEETPIANIYEINREANILNSGASIEDRIKEAMELSHELGEREAIIKQEVPEQEKVAFEISAEEVEELSQYSRKKSYGIELSPVQKILFEYVKRKIESGMNPEEIREILEENAEKQELCTFLDIARVLKHAFELIRQERGEAETEIEETPEKLTTATEQKKPKIVKFINSKVVKKEDQPGLEYSSGGEGFLRLLRENSDHEYSTVELYKKLGLSARKGNKIREKLMEQGMIRIEEQKNDRGWKKIIRLI